MPTPKLLHHRTSLRLPSGAPLRLVVVADTHSAPHPRAEECIAELRPDRILHAGDIGDLGVVERLAAIAPTSVVRGNIDVRAPELPDALTIAFHDGEDAEPLLTLLLLHIAVAGPRLRADAARLARGERADLVVCGHSHVPYIGRDRGIGIFNPGSVGPRRFHLPIVFGVMDVAPERVTLQHIDCETGARWLP